MLREMVAAAELGAAQFGDATFADLCEAWLDAVGSRLALNTVAETRRILTNHLLPALGDVPLRKLRSEHFDHLYAQLLEHGGRDGKHLSGDTVRRVHGIARRALDIAVRSGWIPSNPASSIAPQRTYPIPRGMVRS